MPSDAKPKRVRIVAFDSMRFVLAMGIVLGHFVKFANPSDFVYKLCSQHNVIVGFFFALSGYMTAYTSTENGERAASPRLVEAPAQKWILSRVFGYFPLHLMVLLLFAPMFLFVDVTYNGWPTALWNGLLSATMTQAWFPFAAEVWNAPTWFLSSLTLATACMPFALPKIATLDQPGLRRMTGWLWVITVLHKVGYAADLNAWSIFEGITAPKAHPNIAVFNMIRFHPLGCIAEVFLGVLACRLVMLDDNRQQSSSPLLPLLALVGVFVAKATGHLAVSDVLLRSALALPLFLNLCMAIHRSTVAGTKSLVRSLLSHPLLVSLGNLTFPIFILHGPIGQVFFKKIVAKKLFGQVLQGPAYFGLYLVTTLVSAQILQTLFLENSAVQNWSKKAVNQLSSWM